MVNFIYKICLEYNNKRNKKGCDSIKRKNFNYEEYLKYKKDDKFNLLIFSMFMSFFGLIFLIKQELIFSIICFLLIAIMSIVNIYKNKRLKKRLIEYENNLKCLEMQKIINSEIFNLIKLMNKIGLDKNMVFYTSNNFTKEFEECNNYKDYQRLYENIFDTIRKYKNYSKEFIMNENIDINNEIVESLLVLELPVGTKDWNIIKNKYRKLLKLTHPDISSEKVNEIRTKELNAAYNILKKYYRQ